LLEVRGVLWPGAADTVLLIHDVGDDLDSWGALPAALAGQGYRVIAIDLPGHGLSDDPWEPVAAKEVLDFVISSARRGQRGKCFAISIGSIAPVVGSLHADALIALSPSPGSEWSRETISTPCLIFVGGADAAAADAANRYFRGRTGWTVVSSFGTAENGAALLTSLGAVHVNEQILAFLRDYRSP
jgi:pimeloyl-ACP methyl ester carboxylesterase